MKTFGVLVLMMVAVLLRTASAKVVRQCEGGTLGLRCTGGSIAIDSANYGRRASCDICPHSQTSNTNCASSNSESIVTTTCGGQQSCSVSASNSVFGDPCVGTYKYLEVSYFCRARACEHRDLTISCPCGQTIFISEANYGRLAGSNVCPHSQIHTTNCRAANSLAIVRNACQGRQSCTVSATNTVFGDPCVGTYKYLEVLYDCQ